MEIEIYGDQMTSESDFHNEIARQLNVENYYGKNLDALWDLLSTGVERPLNLIWLDVNISKEKIRSFDKIISVFDRVRNQDEQSEWEDKFTYTLIP